MVCVHPEHSICLDLPLGHEVRTGTPRRVGGRARDPGKFYLPLGSTGLKSKKRENDQKRTNCLAWLGVSFFYPSSLLLRKGTSKYRKTYVERKQSGFTNPTRLSHLNVEGYYPFQFICSKGWDFSCSVSSHDDRNLYLPGKGSQGKVYTGPLSSSVYAVFRSVWTNWYLCCRQQRGGGVYGCGSKKGESKKGKKVDSHSFSLDGNFEFNHPPTVVGPETKRRVSVHYPWKSQQESRLLRNTRGRLPSQSSFGLGGLSGRLPPPSTSTGLTPASFT